MPSSKELRRRIKSIRSTRQITRAMELVAAVKMRKAQQAAIMSRAYAKLAWELTQSVSGKAHPAMHKLLRQPEEIRNVGILLITSNRGLIGGFNNSIINQALEFVQKGTGDLSRSVRRGGRTALPRPGEGLGERSNRSERFEFITIGKKGRDALRKRGYQIVAEFDKQDGQLGMLDVRPIARLLLEDFIIGQYDKVVLVYMDFVSTLKQTPQVLELLPITKVEESLPATSYQLPAEDYLFEPSPDLVLEILLPRLTEMQIYQAYLETNAAEHSARMVAMKNATDAAGDLISELTLDYNKLRQASITKEISEIVAGKLALTI